MHYAIQHQSQSFPYLHTTSRKKSLKNILLRVDNGLVLLRMGKMEYAVEPGQFVWVPFDCLTAMSYFPNTLVQSVEISSRVTLPMPKQGGFVEPNELTNAIINRLAQTTESSPSELLNVLKLELASIKPVLALTPLSEQINQWAITHHSSLTPEIQLVLKMREVRKRLLSGQKELKVVEELFNGQREIFTQLSSSILGH
ncbi:AraC family transcriptional regulator [Vibrio sp. NTOU-M3]|uniref:AraC family transcriptional regulator n=1 Tax=Vibrio sp. NTOU-M3 TaxID=3234954 RepID=UPI00349F5D6E